MVYNSIGYQKKIDLSEFGDQIEQGSKQLQSQAESRKSFQEYGSRFSPSREEFQEQMKRERYRKQSPLDSYLNERSQRSNNSVPSSEIDNPIKAKRAGLDLEEIISGHQSIEPPQSQEIDLDAINQNAKDAYREGTREKNLKKKAAIQRQIDWAHDELVKFQDAGLIVETDLLQGDINELNEEMNMVEAELGESGESSGE